MPDNNTTIHNPYQRLILTHHIGVWDGTFGATAAFMVNEIISNDNTPITVALSGYREDSDEEEEYEDEAHTIVEVDVKPPTLITDTGQRIDLEFISTLSI
jgi:hypothetical protein